EKADRRADRLPDRLFPGRAWHRHRACQHCRAVPFVADVPNRHRCRGHPARGYWRAGRSVDAVRLVIDLLVLLLFVLAVLCGAGWLLYELLLISGTYIAIWKGLGW